MLAIGLPVVPPRTLDLHAVNPSMLLPPSSWSLPAAAAPDPGSAAPSSPASAADESGGSLRSSFDQPAALQAADSGDSGAAVRHGATHNRSETGRKRRRKASGGRGAKARRVARTFEDDNDFIVDDDDDEEDEAEDSQELSSEADSDPPSIAASGSDLDSEPDSAEVVSSGDEGGGRNSGGGGGAIQKLRKAGAKGAKQAAAGAARPGLKVVAWVCKTQCTPGPQQLCTCFLITSVHALEMSQPLGSAMERDITPCRSIVNPSQQSADIICPRCARRQACIGHGQRASARLRRRHWPSMVPPSMAASRTPSKGRVQGPCPAAACSAVAAGGASCRRGTGL